MVRDLSFAFFAAMLIGCGGGVSGSPVADGGTDGGADGDPATDAATGPTLGAPCTNAGELGCQGVGQKLQLLCDGTKWVSNGVCSGEEVCDPRPGSTLGSCQKPACAAGVDTCEGAWLTKCDADLLTKMRTDCTSAEHCKQAVGGVCAKCLASEAKCEGAVLMTCSSDRQSLVMKETCATPELCDALTAACKPAACATEEHRCSGNILEKCNAARSAFDPVMVCAAGLCDATGKECDECTPLAVDCVGKTPRTCDSTGRWKPGTACSGSTPVCRAGTCVPGACSSGDHRCTGDILEQCNSELTGFDPVRVCPPGLCDATGKECDECKSGTAECIGETPRACDSTGHWRTLTACSGSTPLCRSGVCSAGACVAGEHRCSGNVLEKCNTTFTGFTGVMTCSAGLCDATGKECDECAVGAKDCVGNTPRLCDTTGHWTTLTACSGSTPLCKAGSCAPPVCLAGDHRCSGDVLEKCNSGLSGFDPVMTCGAGLCDATGKECDDCVSGGKSCAGSTPRTCDSTGHWLSLTPCMAPTPGCSAGVCTTCVAGQIVKDIAFDQTTGWASTGCCMQSNYRVAGALGSTLTASFNDAIPSGHVVKAVSVRFGVEHACSAVDNAMAFALNGTSIGKWNSSMGPDCSCGDTRVGAATFSAPIGAYKSSGAKNDVTIVHNDGGSCHEAITSVPTAPAGTAVRVVIDYGCP